MNEATQFWTMVPSLRLRWRCWGDESIVYNCNSGDVYLLNAVAAEALKIIQCSKISVDALIERVGQSLSIDTGDDLGTNVAFFVNKLACLGLICPADDSI
jgi:PqqD family protein of HPr-rel-A system